MTWIPLAQGPQGALHRLAQLGVPSTVPRAPSQVSPKASACFTNQPLLHTLVYIVGLHCISYVTFICDQFNSKFISGVIFDMLNF